MSEIEYKQIISISDIYSNEEIKSLKKQFPEINNILSDSYTNKKQQIAKNKFFTIFGNNSSIVEFIISLLLYMNKNEKFGVVYKIFPKFKYPSIKITALLSNVYKL